MHPTTLPTARTAAQARAQTDPPAAAAAPGDPAEPPRLDLSRLEPPRKLEEARLEEVTIDGICGVY